MKAGRRKVQAAEIPVIAAFTGVPPPPELVPVEKSFMRIKIIGYVQAGHYADPGDVQEYGGETIEAPMDDVFRTIRKFALKVAGPSMNLVYPEGTILVCADIHDLHETGDPLAGKKYIVRRTMPDGRIETTVKEVNRDDEGVWWLWPRSDDPKHQQPIPLSGIEGEIIEAYARVLFSFKVE